jgi:hypothetical protein
MIPLQPTLEEVSALFHHLRPPAGLVAKLIQYDDGDYYAIRFYRDNFDKLTPMDKWAVMNWANETLGLMNQLIPTVVEIWRTPGVK